MNTVEKLGELRRAGVNVGMLFFDTSPFFFSPSLKKSAVRMNFSHGSYEYHQSVIDNTRKMVAGECLLFPSEPPPPLMFPSSADPSGRPVAIALDTVRSSPSSS